MISKISWSLRHTIMKLKNFSQFYKFKDGMLLSKKLKLLKEKKRDWLGTKFNFIGEKHVVWLIEIFFWIVQFSYQTVDWSKLCLTRKYPIRKYILGVLLHTTAWDWHSGEVMKHRNEFYIHSLALPCLTHSP